MNKSEILALFDQEQRIEVEYPGMRREVTSHLVRHIDTSKDGEGTVIYSQLDEVNADDVIREQVRYFESLGQDFEWKQFDHDSPADLKERLRKLGFIIEEAEALMVLDLAKAPDVLWNPVSQRVQRIHDPERISDILSIEAQVWNEDFSALGDYLREALTHYPEQLSVYVAYVDEVPSSAAWIYFPRNSQFGSLWGGASLSAYRKRGLYTSLLAVRAQEARARQVNFLSVEASPMSRPITEKFGFEFMDWTTPCKWKKRLPK